ncbi:MAG: hypothetical protein NVV74_02885 [Magnetospirillum sp.]|nr:hypothetical protein [Magnetospirillum sp.]
MNDIATHDSNEPVHNRLRARHRWLGRRPIPADYGWVADQMQFLHDWLTLVLPAPSRKKCRLTAERGQKMPLFIPLSYIVVWAITLGQNAVRIIPA